VEVGYGGERKWTREGKRKEGKERKFLWLFCGIL
jgi:hypothetical protein